MLFSLFKHYFEFYIIDTSLKVSWSLYCFTTSMSHGVADYFPRLLGTGISDAIFSLLINAVILLLNCLVLILYLYTHFLSLRCYFLYLNIIWNFI